MYSMDTMDIFISWSGSKSKKVAEALKEFLGTILQATKPLKKPSKRVCSFKN